MSTCVVIGIACFRKDFIQNSVLFLLVKYFVLCFSVKECFYMRGTCSTAGLLRFHGTRKTIDCPAVLTVRRLGALPFCKTNVPQVSEY
jgi:hypothetical protein